VALLPMFRIVIKNLLTGPATRRYPYVVRENFASCRGRVTIDYPACIHCGACSRRCPAAAIIVGKEPKSWRIDNFACDAGGLLSAMLKRKQAKEGHARHIFVGGKDSDNSTLFVGGF
jgi:ferredoxin